MQNVLLRRHGGLVLQERRARLTDPAGRRRVFRHVAFCLLSCFLASAATTYAADWPTFRGDIARSGATPEAAPRQLETRWVYTAPAAPKIAWSGPDGRTIEGKELRHRVDFDASLGVVVAEGRAFVSSSVDHQVHAIDVSSGEEAWTFFTGAPVRLAATVWQGRVFFGSDDGHAYALDAASGQLIWQVRAGPEDDWLLARGEMISRWPVRTSVLVDKGVAYFGAGIFPHENIQIYAVSASSGEVIWRRDDISQSNAGRNDLSPQGYLLATQDLLFVPSGRSLPAAVTRATGELLHKRIHGWRRDAGGVVGGARALLVDGQLFAAGTHHMLALDQNTGDVGHGWFAGRQMAVAGEAAAVATGTEIRRLDRKTYALASRERHKLEVEIYDATRKLRRLEDESEKKTLRAAIEEKKSALKKIENEGIVWRVPSELQSDVIIAGDVVVAGGQEKVTLHDMASGREIAQVAVDGDARALAVANGCLFVTTTRGKVYCFAANPEQAERVADSRGAPTATRQPFAQDEWTETYRHAATEILEQSGVQRGFCLVVDSDTGRLAYELARQSDLKIYAVHRDPQKVATARQALAEVGLYGHRVTFHVAESSRLSYSNYFANLIVSERFLTTRRPPASHEDLMRHLKPCGGVLFLGQPTVAGSAASPPPSLRDWVARVQLEGEAVVSESGPWMSLVRGPLPGAGDWSHQYGEPGNTACSNDQRIKGGLGVLWYGDPGPGKMVNRHEGAVGPVVVYGRLFVQGENSILAYDAYNGVFLWEHKNPLSLRTGVFKNENPSNLVAGDDSVFYMVGAKCVELEAATGSVKAEYGLPLAKSSGEYEWGYLAYNSGRIFGSATIRKRLEEKLIRRGKQTDEFTDAVFAIDVRSGEHLWTYEGQSVEAQTIAIDARRVFFVDSTVTSEEREAILRRDKSELVGLEGEERELAEKRLKEMDVRRVVCLDAKTGEKRWSRAVDVTDCSEIGIGGGKLTVMVHDGTILLCGANANGHYWKQFLAGEFSRRRLVALSAADGYQLWAKDANYRHRPIIVGNRVLAEPWAFRLDSGQEIQRDHPLTGAKAPWSMIRPGHHCGMISASSNMLLFRSGYTGFYDLETDDGTRHFAGHRLGCWINAIPAAGLVLIPEASAGCVCLFSIASTVALQPRQARRPWTIVSAVGPVQPVKHMALNLGAPGDRRDVNGNLWLAYPRPALRRETGLDLAFEVKTEFAEGGGFSDSEAAPKDMATPEPAWLYQSGARGLQSCVLPLIGAADETAAVYSITLHLVTTAEASAKKSPEYSVRVQGVTVPLDGVQAAQDSEGSRVLVHSVDGVDVEHDLTVELVADSSSANVPVLCGVEVRRTSGDE